MTLLATSRTLGCSHLPPYHSGRRLDRDNAYAADPERRSLNSSGEMENSHALISAEAQFPTQDIEMPSDNRNESDKGIRRCRVGDLLRPFVYNHSCPSATGFVATKRLFLLMKNSAC